MPALLTSLDHRSEKSALARASWYSAIGALSPQDTWDLAAASASWFLFDTYSYGVAVYSPVILDWIFGESIAVDCLENIICSLVGAPAVLFTIFSLDPIFGGNAARCQTVGFAVAAAVFFVFATAWLVNAPSTLLFGLFVLLRFALMFSVSTTTFVIPPMLFEPRIRASCAGTAAAAGKLGALISTFAMDRLAQAASAASVFYIFGCVALAGAIVTAAILEPAFRAARFRDVSAPDELRAYFVTHCVASFVAQVALCRQASPGAPLAS